MIRVLLVDDHALVRAGIRSLLGAMADVQVVGEAASGEEALEVADRERPDVVLMDIAMKGITGLESAAQMRERYPEVRVVILSMHSGEEYVLQALRAGAVGYLLKDAATGELELALRSVMRGESWLSPSVSRQVVEGYMHRTGGEAAPEVLTARQREVLKLVAGGKSTKEIAFLLNLSVKTVETHRAQIMERLGIRDVAGLVRYALRTVIRGESWLSPAVSRQVVEGYVQRVGGDAGADVLTARQREVLRLVAGGKSTKEIAFALNLSVKTVETHRAQIMERLGIRDVAGLVRYALRTGLIPPEG